VSETVWMSIETGYLLVREHDEQWGWIWSDDEGFFVDEDAFYATFEKLGDL
jgi:hypothetical protein